MKNKRLLCIQHIDNLRSHQLRLQPLSQLNKQSIPTEERKMRHTSHQPHATLVHPCNRPPKSLKQSQKSFLPSMILSSKQTFISAPWTHPSRSLSASYFPLHQRFALKSEKPLQLGCNTGTGNSAVSQPW